MEKQMKKFKVGTTNVFLEEGTRMTQKKIETIAAIIKALEQHGQRVYSIYENRNSLNKHMVFNYVIKMDNSGFLVRKEESAVDSSGDDWEYSGDEATTSSPEKPAVKLRRWTKDEDEYLEDFGGTESWDKMTKYLNRSKAAITMRMFRLGIARI